MAGVIVLNFEEFAAELGQAIDVGPVDMDLTGLENIFKEYFPLIMDYLDDILHEITKFNDYLQRAEGFHLTPTNIKNPSITFRNTSVITGITLSHDSREGIHDYFDLSVTLQGSPQIIFNNIYLKDFIHKKEFKNFIPMPAGTKVEILHHSKSKVNNIWYDIEFMEDWG